MVLSNTEINKIAMRVVELLAKSPLVPKPEKTMDLSEASTYLGRSESWVYKNKQLLGFKKMGNRVMFTESALYNYLHS